MREHGSQRYVEMMPGPAVWQTWYIYVSLEQCLYRVYVLSARLTLLVTQRTGCMPHE